MLPEILKFMSLTYKNKKFFWRHLFPNSILNTPWVCLKSTQNIMQHKQGTKRKINKLPQTMQQQQQMAGKTVRQTDGRKDRLTTLNTQQHVLNKKLQTATTLLQKHNISRDFIEYSCNNHATAAVKKFMKKYTK